MDKSNYYFDEDIIVDTLLRLPVISLMRFKSVSKSWYTLIKSWTFIYNHLNRYNADSTRLLLSYSDSFQHEPQYGLFPDETLTDLSYQDLNLYKPTFGNQCTTFRHLGHGLICMYGIERHRVLLWNPATRQSRFLPKIETNPHTQHVYFCSVGFQLDHKNNDYKLVLLRTVDDDDGFSYVFPHVSIYTLYTNCWRDFEATELNDYYELDFSSQNTYFNGCCFWLAKREDDIKVILSFKMDTEVFREIDGPFMHVDVHATLELCDDHLSLVLFDIVTNYFEIWVMKEIEKKKECYWTKQAIVGPLPPIYKPLGLWKNGAVFASTETEQLLLYDTNTQESKDFGLTNDEMEIHKYKESLLPVTQDDRHFYIFNIPWSILGVYDADSDN